MKKVLLFAKSILRQTGNWLARHWRGLVFFFIVLALAVFTLGLKINGVVPGQNSFETETLANISSFPKPWVRAVNAPYAIPAHLLGGLLNDPLLGARVTSVIFCLLATACFFYIIKFWFKSRFAAVGTLLFITSSWLLNISHQASNLSWMVLAPLIVILSLAWYLKTTKHNLLAFYVFAGSLALSAYAPYAFWIMAATLVILLVRGRHKIVALKSIHIIIGAAIYLLLLFMLFFSLANHPGQIKELVGIPAVLPSLSQYFSNFVGLLSTLFIKSNNLPQLHLAQLPLLDAFSAAMFLLGIFYFIRRLPRRSSLIFLASFALLVVVLPINPNYQWLMAILLPFVYLATISGVAELLIRWFAYFPRNPLMRNLGVALIVTAIGFSCYYHLNNYYIAWPNAPETQAVYVLKFKE